MKIQLNSNRHIEQSELLDKHIRRTLTNALGRNSLHVTRIEVYLSDENRNTHNNSGKRCLMEARLEGLQPIAVSSHGRTLDLAIDGAIKKLGNIVKSTLGRQRNQRHTRTDPMQSESEWHGNHLLDLYIIV